LFARTRKRNLDDQEGRAGRQDEELSHGFAGEAASATTSYPNKEGRPPPPSFPDLVVDLPEPQRALGGVDGQLAIVAVGEFECQLVDWVFDRPVGQDGLDRRPA
jgi:hypothetical protein